jgi:hypothetical protein
MRETGYPEALDQHRIQTRRVAVHQPGQQATLGVRQPVRGLPQTGTNAPGLPLPPRRLALEDRWCPGEHRHAQRACVQ